MNWFWANIPLMVVFFAAIVGIPLWLSFRHPDTGPATLAVPARPDDLAILAALLPEAELVGVS
jgi:hypothetical protein